MSQLNERQIALRSRTSSQTTLADYLDTVDVGYTAFSAAKTVTVAAAAQFALISSTQQSGNIALGTSSGFSGSSYFAVALSTAVGTAATTNAVDSNGNYLNRVAIRDSTTHDQIVVSGYEVFGLIQAASTATDGQAIAASGSENLQISFAYIDNAGTLTLATLNASATTGVNFGMRIATRLRNRLNVQSVGDPSSRPEVAQASSATRNRRRLTVTAAFVANEVITLSTGSGASAGTSTPAGSGDGADTISTLGASAATFNTNDNLSLYLNGVLQVKGIDIVYDSTGTLHFTAALYVNDVVYIDELL